VIESHLPAVTEPRLGERCVLCNEPAGKVVLGPIERVSGLRRRTPVCTKCANSRRSRPRRWRWAVQRVVNTAYAGSIASLPQKVFRP